MAKFHLNPSTGVPGVCSAQAGKCPFGGASDHHDSAREAVAAFEASFESSLPGAVAKKSVDAVGQFQSLRAAEEKAEALLSERGLSDAERKKRHTDFLEKRAKAAEALTALERAGLGHTVPDRGNTIRVANRAQKVLIEEQLLGQMSDGMWENTNPQDHWKVWHEADIIVDAKNVGVNFLARKNNYAFNSTNLVSIVGDEMIGSVKAEENHGGYDQKQLRKDLAEVSKVFKTERATHTAEKAAADLTPAPVRTPKAAPAPRATPAPAASPTPATAPAAPRTKRGKSTYGMNTSDNADQAMVPVAMGGPGRSLSTDRYFTLHSGMANPTNGDGDNYGHVKEGGVVIVGKADGSRARVIAGASEFLTDPGAELGRSIEQTKQSNTNKDSVRSDLYVLGYRDRNGNKFGWVPNKKIQYFVFK